MELIHRSQNYHMKNLSMHSNRTKHYKKHRITSRAMYCHSKVQEVNDSTAGAVTCTRTTSIFTQKIPFFYWKWQTTWRYACGMSADMTHNVIKSICYTEVDLCSGVFKKCVGRQARFCMADNAARIGFSGFKAVKKGFVKKYKVTATWQVF